ncbi:immunoglobulin gamma-1 heavy chain-like [Mobula hypostoma]|uniref:immunoglobulin gamma-1 heavy chain-like n=1 Tax=Mobula hypostoma TaxID=723540 RepID=UPI002FC2ACAC
MSKSDSVLSKIWGIPYYCLLLLCLPGVQSDIRLEQPESEMVKAGQSHKLTCAVSGFSLSSYHMYWVKQVSGKGPEWVAAVWANGDKNYAPGVEGRFEVSKDSSTVYLQMNNLILDDTATYYCARDTVREIGSRPKQKPSEFADRRQSDIVLTRSVSAVAKTGQTHRLTCAVSGFASAAMTWPVIVKLVSGKGLEWVAVVWDKGIKKHAPGVQDRFQVYKDSSTVYLQMNNLRLEDTATYYCARDTVKTPTRDRE